MSRYDRRMTDVLEPLAPIRLTDLTDCGGCAAKLGADLLADALSGLGAEASPEELIAGLTPPDDAAVYRLSPELAVIGTLDFFPPLVDDPATFGAIAAANALSDVFAMGGRVLFALSIAAFPEDLPRDVLAAIFGGASAKVREAGGTLAGGHTIRDAEPKYGLAVIGAAHPDRLLRKGGARAGDSLILTKRLGTGILVSGNRQGLTGAADLDAAVSQMLRLNRAAAEVLVANGIRGATDVTGFGLLGHGLEMARASGTRFRVHGGRAAGIEWRDGPRRQGRGNGRRRTQPEVRLRLPCRRARAYRPIRSPSPTTRRHPAACSPRCRRNGWRMCSGSSRGRASTPGPSVGSMPEWPRLPSSDALPRRAGDGSGHG